MEDNIFVNIDPLDCPIPHPELLSPYRSNIYCDIKHPSNNSLNSIFFTDLSFAIFANSSSFIR